MWGGGTHMNTIYSYHQIHDKFPPTPMGGLAHKSAHARPSAQPPIELSGIVLVHMSAEVPPKIRILGEGVVPEYFSYWNPIIF